MEHKHTEGPWIFHPEAREISGPPGSGVIVARLPEWGTAADATDPSGSNARLIAAAPELLEALQRLKIEVVLSDVDPDYIESHFRLWLNKAEAAIAKATGEEE